MLSATTPLFQTFTSVKAQITGFPLVEVHSLSEDPRKVALTIRPVKEGDPLHGIILQAASSQFFQTSFLATAQEQAAERKKESEMKAIKVKKRDATCLNPNSSTGVCVTKTVLEEVRIAHLNTEAKKRSKSDKVIHQLAY